MGELIVLSPTDFTDEEIQEIRKNRDVIGRLLDSCRNKRFEIDKDLFQMSALVSAICFAFTSTLYLSGFEKLSYLPILAGILSGFTAIISGYRVLFKWHLGELKSATSLLGVYTKNTDWKTLTKDEYLTHNIFMIALIFLLMTFILLFVQVAIG